MIRKFPSLSSLVYPPYEGIIMPHWLQGRPEYLSSALFAFFLSLLISINPSGEWLTFIPTVDICWCYKSNLFLGMCFRPNVCLMLGLLKHSIMLQLNWMSMIILCNMTFDRRCLFPWFRCQVNTGKVSFTTTYVNNLLWKKKCVLSV